MLMAAAAGTALMMGLVGGVHCVAMCSAPCGALINAGGDSAVQERAQPLRWLPQRRSLGRSLVFHGGRLAGYASVGALAAFAMESLAWLTQQTMALKPVWTLAHVAVMVWGLMLMMQARQPAWLESGGRRVWARIKPMVEAPGGLGVAGYLWGLMPCGLLYSALLVAALSGGAIAGASTMLAFGVGSGLWLWGGPVLWGMLRRRVNAIRAEWGTRLAGLLLAAMAGWALWLDLVYKPSLWCR